jgi:hypothetical protein
MWLAVAARLAEPQTKNFGEKRAGVEGFRKTLNH